MYTLGLTYAHEGSYTQGLEDNENHVAAAQG